MFAYDLSRRFESLGLEVRTIYLYADDDQSSLPLHEGDVCLRGRERHPFERLPGFEPSLLKNLMRRISEFQPDVVQANGGRTVKYAAAAKRVLGSRARWKLVYRNIGIASYWHHWIGSVLAYRSVIMPQIDGVVGVSAESLADVKQLYRLRAPSTVIMNGVSPERLTPKVKRAEVRRSESVGEDDIVLLFLGKLDAVKRPDRFLRVLSRLRHLPQVRAWVVGDGPLRKETEELSARLGLADRVRFFGTRDDVADLLAAADLLVLTSDSEGVPGVVLEAGLFGLPVIATKVGGLVECVIDGETGILVPVEDEQGFSEAITTLATDHELRDKLGQAGRKRVEGHLTIEPIAERYLGFYHRLFERVSDGGD